MKKIGIYIFMVILVASCTSSQDEDTLQFGYTDMTFSLNVPKATQVSLKSYSESSISKVDVLMFDEDSLYIQRFQVSNLISSSSGITFSVRLPLTSKKRILHIVANGRDDSGADLLNFSDLSIDSKESETIPLLTTETLSANTEPEQPHVMWGRIELPSVTDSTSVSSIDMLRTTAAIDVELPTATTENGLDKFSLTAFSILNTSNKARVAPSDYKSSAITPTSVSLPSSYSYIDYISSSGTGLWAYSSDRKSTPDLYLYERENVLDDTGVSVIIRGSYDGQDCYYKVWLKNQSGDLLDVVRNHKYVIEVSKVYGAGYQTIEEAVAASYSSNISVDVSDNNDDITDIIADSYYELGISSNAFAIKGDGVKSLGTVLKTNTSASLSLSSSVSWISNLSYTQSGTRYYISGTLATTTSTRTGTVTVRAGNLVRTISITQES